MFDLLAHVPRAGEKLGPDLHNLPNKIEQIKSWTALYCYRYVSNISEGLRYLLLFRTLFPDEYAASAASMAHVSHDRARILGPNFAPRFSDRELEFFQLVAEHLFPLRDEFYRTMPMGQDLNWLPIYVDYYGIIPQFLHEEYNLGKFILVATANAVVNDSLWQSHLRTVGLSVVQHLPRCLKEEHALALFTLKFDTIQIFAGMLDYDPIYRYLDEAWRYATARTGSIFLDVHEDQVINGDVAQHEWNLDDIRLLAADWKQAKIIKHHFDDLCRHLKTHPEQIQALLELIGRHHIVNQHKPVRDEILMASVMTVGDQADFDDAVTAYERQHRLHPPECHYPPSLEPTDLTGVNHA